MKSAPHPRLGPPTLSVGRIEGGVSVNTVPDGVRDRGRPPASARRGPARRHWREFPTTVTARAVPVSLRRQCGWPARPSSAAGPGDCASGFGKAIDAVEGRHEVLAVPFGTDASTIAEAGIPAVVFGPGRHRPGAHEGRVDRTGSDRPCGRDSLPIRDRLIGPVAVAFSSHSGIPRPLDSPRVTNRRAVARGGRTAVPAPRGGRGRTCRVRHWCATSCATRPSPAGWGTSRPG